MPGTKRFICAPGKNQSAKIAKDKIYEIWDKLPLLKKEIIGDGNFGKDYVTLMFRNGSIFDVVGALDTERGQAALTHLFPFCKRGSFYMANEEA